MKRKTPTSIDHEPRHRDATARFRQLIRATEIVVGEIEEINLRGARTVPSSIRQQVAELIFAITGEELRPVPLRCHGLLNSVYRAQAQLLCAKSLSIGLEIEGDQLASD